MRSAVFCYNKMDLCRLKIYWYIWYFAPPIQCGHFERLNFVIKFFLKTFCESNLIILDCHEYSHTSYILFMIIILITMQFYTPA